MIGNLIPNREMNKNSAFKVFLVLRRNR